MPNFIRVRADFLKTYRLISTKEPFKAEQISRSEPNIGDIDLLGEVAGIGDYAEVEMISVEMRAFDCEIKVLSIDGLIKAKRAAGRVKDLLVLPELEALREVLAEAENGE